VLEVEIRQISVRSQPKQKVSKTLSRKTPSQKRAGGMAQGVGLGRGREGREKKEKQMDSICQVE
jgi:hypothetical protein